MTKSCFSSRPIRLPSRLAIALAALVAFACPDIGGAQPAVAGTDLTGVWQPSAALREVRTTEGKAPPLLPAAQALYDRNRAAIRAGDRGIDGTNRCLPAGLPRILFEATPIEVMQRSDKIYFFFEYQRLLQPIFIDGEHPSDLALNPFLGHSTGRWEGSTLVIDTVSLDDTTLLDASGLPHSDALHVVQRISLVDNGRQMRIEITVDDPKIFSRPWQTVRVLERKPGLMLKEDVCLDRQKLATSGE